MGGGQVEHSEGPSVTVTVSGHVHTWLAVAFIVPDPGPLKVSLSSSPNHVELFLMHQKKVEVGGQVCPPRVIGALIPWGSLSLCCDHRWCIRASLRTPPRGCFPSPRRPWMTSSSPSLMSVSSGWPAATY